MSQDDESQTLNNEVRAAFLRLADKAPDPAGVRAGLDRATRVYRQRRAMLLAGSVAVGAGVIGGGVLAANRLFAGTDPLPPDGYTPANLPPAVSPPPPSVGNVTVPLRYRPTWLPLGFVERLRSTTVNSTPGQLHQRREWYPADRLAGQGGHVVDDHAEGPYIYLDLVPESFWEIAGWRVPVRINGARGGLGPAGSSPVVLWEAGGGLNLGLSVSGFEDDRETALQIARSVVRDGVSATEIGLEFGWWPSGLDGLQQFALDPAGSTLEVIVDRISVVSVTIDTPHDLSGREGAEQVTIRGVPATRFVGTATMVALTLPDGRPLSVIVQSTVLANPDDVTRLIETMRIGPRPDTTWVGSR